MPLQSESARPPPADGAPAARVWPLVPGAPRLTQARCELLREIQILDEYGDRRSIHIPAERPLTVFVDKREIVTLMTLGACPELLVLGYLRNQRLITQVRRGRIGHRRLGRGRCRRAHRTRACRYRPVDRASCRHHGLRPGHRVWRRDEQVGSVNLPDVQRGAHSPEHAAPHARNHAPARQHPPQGGLGARLCAVPPGSARSRTADVRRRRGPSQRHRHHRRLDVHARRDAAATRPSTRRAA
jgi:hypothetical protein